MFGFTKRPHDEGATTSEYAILVALIAIVIVAAVGTLGLSVRDLFRHPTLTGVFAL